MPSSGRRRLVRVGVAALFVTGLVCAAPATVAAQSAERMYTSALARERSVRDAEHKPTLKQLRSLADAYLRVVSRFPRSGYSDNALWQAAGVYALAYERFGEAIDRRHGEEALRRMRTEYSSSSLVARVDEIEQLLSHRTSRPPISRPTREAPAPAAAPVVQEVADKPTSQTGVSTLSEITRSEIGNTVRVTLELDAEIAYHEERVEDPARVFFDLKNVRLGPGLKEAPINYRADVLRQVRVGSRPDGSTRIAMDLHGVSRYSVFTLYNPYRLVVDFERTVRSPVVNAASSVERPPSAATTTATTGRRAAERDPLPVGASPLRVKSAPVVAAPSSAPAPPPGPGPDEDTKTARPLPSEPTKPASAPAPTVPSANKSGDYSLARQLGLGVSRIVIDAGHGGHDPGAHGHGVVEAELVLDVARRLEKLLLDEEGMEVVMTRRTDVFIPLEERTAIANRAGADLFLSIHANASRNRAASGVETYYLNFASNPEAEEVAARENSASSRTLHVLPDIIRAIALNNKLDESRDFAEFVQKAMSRRLRPQNGQLKSLGVKRAPFVVLIGASMPSVLAEISFVTNKQEAVLLKSGAYRQRIAQALCDAVTQYQRSLKKVTAVADSSAR